MGQISIHLAFRRGRLLVDTVCRPPLYQEGNVPQLMGLETGTIKWLRAKVRYEQFGKISFDMKFGGE